MEFTVVSRYLVINYQIACPEVIDHPGSRRHILCREIGCCTKVACARVGCGRPVAYLVPSEQEAIRGELAALIRQGLIHWKGGKPVGLARPVRVAGKRLSEMILEDRE